MRALLFILSAALAAARLLAAPAPTPPPEIVLPADLPGDFGLASRSPLDLPPVGAHALHLLSPSVLELLLVTTKAPGGAVDRWDFVTADGTPRLPGREAFQVTVDGAPAE